MENRVMSDVRSVSGGIVTPKEYKEIEGQRVAPVLGAIAALPAAALIGLDSPGAPLFALAIGFAAASYVFWILQDAMYHASCLEVCNADEYARLARDAYHFQAGNVLYAGASVMLSMAGFAGQHSTLRTSISVETGFVVALVTFLMVCVHIGIAVVERNAIDRMIDTAARRQGVPTAF